MGKKGNVKRIVEKATHFDFFAVYIDNITDVVKGEKGNANRNQYFINEGSFPEKSIPPQSELIDNFILRLK
jgi:hypothetical protein